MTLAKTRGYWAPFRKNSCGIGETGQAWGLAQERGENFELVLYSSNLFAHIFGICAQ